MRRGGRKRPVPKGELNKTLYAWLTIVAQESNTKAPDSINILLYVLMKCFLIFFCYGYEKGYLLIYLVELKTIYFVLLALITTIHLFYSFRLRLR